MNDFSSILLLQILRATVRHVDESPELDHAHSGIVDFQQMLEAEIGRLEQQRR